MAVVTTAADGAVSANAAAGFFERFMDGATRRLRPLMSLLVVDFSLYELDSETSESVRDQRLWQEIRGAFGAFLGE